MLISVLNSMTQALYDTFGDGYHYYVEDVEQNLAIPCFTVDTLNPLSRSVNRKDYYRTFPMIVHFFTDDNVHKKQDTYDHAERIMDCLEYITVDGRLIRGERISYELVDDVLVVFITYSFWTEHSETLTPMDELTRVQAKTK